MTDQSRNALLEHESSWYSADTRYLVDAVTYTLADGQRTICVSAACGLSLILLPDRGLDIWQATYRGIPLTWLSPGSPYRADAGLSWLSQFNGGLLTTCGLTHTGPAETDDRTGELHGVHGRYSLLPAQNISITRTEDGMSLQVQAAIWQTTLFGEQIVLQRTMRFTAYNPSVHILDRVTNHGDQPLPLMILYHFNAGFPVVREGSRFVVAGRVFPRDADARLSQSDWQIYAAPSVSFREQVFYHHVMADETGQARAAITHDDIGIYLKWDTSTLPYLTQWKNMRQTKYVNGIEPGNCIPEGQNAARAAQRLVMLHPQETQHFSIETGVLDGQAAVAEFHNIVKQVGDSGHPVHGCRLDELEHTGDDVP